MKNKNEIILLIVVAICLIGLGGYMWWSNGDSSDDGVDTGNETPSTTVQESDISTEIINDIGYEITTNTIRSKTALAILIHSNEESNQMLKIKAELFNSDGDVVSSSEVYEPILGNSYLITSVPFSQEEDKILEVDSIHIEVTKEGEYYTGLGSKDIELVYQNQIEESKLKTNLTLIYHNSIAISDISGGVVAMKEGKIVDFAQFTQKNVTSEVENSVTVPDIEFTGSENIENEYDNVLVFVNSFGFGLE